jgi:hypothetical protein
MYKKHLSGGNKQINNLVSGIVDKNVFVGMFDVLQLNVREEIANVFNQKFSSLLPSDLAGISHFGF